jgi:hypothetical protein
MFHLTSARMVIKEVERSAVKDIEKRESMHTAGECVN